MPTESPTLLFPRDDSLCESCGYSLRGLASQQTCPECGRLVAESDPAHRPGLAWQHRIGPLAWLATSRAIAFSPKISYRALRLGGSNLPDRLYLLTYAAIIGAMWGLVWHTAMLGQPIGWSIGAAAGVIGMTYIEVLGVTFFSRRRGWRIPWRLAERVACYAAVGWVPAAMLCVKAFMLVWSGDLFRLGRRWGGAWDTMEVFVPVVVLSLSILWFETLVWLGAREVRFANASL